MKAEAMACHIGDIDQIQADVTFTSPFRSMKPFGKLDILVNNAAANPYFGHILDTELSAFKKTVDVNIQGLCPEAISTCLPRPES